MCLFSIGGKWNTGPDSHRAGGPQQARAEPLGILQLIFFVHITNIPEEPREDHLHGHPPHTHTYTHTYTNSSGRQVERVPAVYINHCQSGRRSDFMIFKKKKNVRTYRTIWKESLKGTASNEKKAFWEMLITVDVWKLNEKTDTTLIPVEPNQVHSQQLVSHNSILKAL